MCLFALLFLLSFYTAGRVGGMNFPVILWVLSASRLEMAKENQAFSLQWESFLLSVGSCCLILEVQTVQQNWLISFSHSERWSVHPEDAVSFLVILFLCGHYNSRVHKLILALNCKLLALKTWWTNLPSVFALLEVVWGQLHYCALILRYTCQLIFS